eukprot:6064608-Pyramimonas_sp.AAC.1
MTTTTKQPSTAQEAFGMHSSTRAVGGRSEEECSAWARPPLDASAPHARDAARPRNLVLLFTEAG